MEFDWDEANIRHIARHNLYPEDVETAMKDKASLNFRVKRGPKRQRRYGRIGKAFNTIIAVIYEYRERKVRVVTARKSIASERSAYDRNRND